MYSQAILTRKISYMIVQEFYFGEVVQLIHQLRVPVQVIITIASEIHWNILPVPVQEFPIVTPGQLLHILKLMVFHYHIFQLIFIQT